MTENQAAAARPETEIDKLANNWVSELAQLMPTLATYIGYPGRDDDYQDFSPAGIQEYVTAVKDTLSRLEQLTPADEVDEITKLDLSNDLKLTIEQFDAGVFYRDLNVLASPAQDVRQAFDLMSRETESDWSNIAKRLANVSKALSGYKDSLRYGAEKNLTPAKRQIVEVAKQTEAYSKNDGFFKELISSAPETLSQALVAELESGAKAAAEAYGEFSKFLAEELISTAPEKDAVGRELYQLASRGFLGATIDLDETYEWGKAELERMVSEQESIAKEILPGASVAEAIAFLEKDSSRKLHGTEALQRWMQETSDRVVKELGETHFEIADPIRKLECMIAPTQEGGIYYTGPTDDFSRPGRMWWSVPVGVTEFDTWRELTTVFHEGVPGHHLQIAQAVYNRGQLNNWRRLLAGSSGHAEGWALYAERLMESLGYLDDPADRLGMLDGQRMRAARVVLDIGVHLEKPKLSGEGNWDAEYALNFFRGHVNMSDEFIKFEVNRYLGWPGQAPSYKVGQRIWEDIRDDYQRQQGADFNMKAFHKKALDLGGVGLDTLRKALKIN